MNLVRTAYNAGRHCRVVDEHRGVLCRATRAKDHVHMIVPQRSIMSGARHRQKGNRVEREIVAAHRALGIHSERYPLSGAGRFRGSGHDIDVYLFGRDEAPIVTEVKARKNGSGFATLEKWLGEFDCLFLKRNHADPLIVLPWRVWARLLEKVRA